MPRKTDPPKPVSTRAPAPLKSPTALRVVDTVTELPGDGSLTREAVAGWKEGQRRCRARKRHNWGPFTIYNHGTWLDVVEQCAHCRNRRSAPYLKTQWGFRKVDKWKPDYRDNYLLPRGAMRLNEELTDELTADDLFSRKMIDVNDDDEESAS